MKRVEILLDDDTAHILGALSASYDGDQSEAVGYAVRAQAATDSLVDEIEAINPEELLRQIERSKRGFREGRSISWEEVKRRASLVTVVCLVIAIRN